MILNYDYHSYGRTSQYDIEVPDDIVFIHEDWDIGRCLYNGYGHYLGCSRTYIENNKLGCRIYTEFPDITLYAFYNVKFSQEIKLISSEEFYSKFNFNDYYIFKTTKDKLNANFNSVEEFLDMSSWIIIPGRLVSISKVVSIQSQNLISLVTCSISSWIDIDNSEVASIELVKNVELSQLLSDNFVKVEVKKDCDKDFIKVLNIVLSRVNKQVI